MFHHLYGHCHDLTWFDISNIDEVWIEIKVDYQFFKKIKRLRHLMTLSEFTFAKNKS